MNGKYGEILKRIRNKLWFKYIIKENEFDKSLDMDHRKMINLTKKERDVYIMDLIKKRNLAHELNMTKDI